MKKINSGQLGQSHFNNRVPMQYKNPPYLILNTASFNKAKDKPSPHIFYAALMAIFFGLIFSAFGNSRRKTPSFTVA